MKRLVLLVMLAALLLGACSSPTPAPEIPPTSTQTSQPVDTEAPTVTPTIAAPTLTATPTQPPTPTLTPEPQNYGPADFPSDVNPLTGLKVADPSRLDRRPLAVKIQIFPRGQRPPWGISLADIVFDYYQNNGLTRFHAIFYGNDAEQVGPIRSARLLDGRLINMYKSVLAFGGADQRILTELLNAGLSDRLIFEGGGICPVMCRIDPNGFNYLVANTVEMSKYATSKGLTNDRQNLNGMSFQLQPPDGGQAGAQLFVRYSISSYNRWDYDPASGRYLRYQDTQEDTGGGEGFAPLLDRNNDVQISASNVVVIFVPHETRFRSGNSEIIEIHIDAGTSGDGYLFRDGKAYPVRWNRPALDSVLLLTRPDGTPIPFKQGNTWYQVMGQSTLNPTKDEGGAWRFEMRLP